MSYIVYKKVNGNDVKVLATKNKAEAEYIQTVLHSLGNPAQIREMRL